MVAAGLLPMEVQVISVSLPSLTMSSRDSMIGFPGGTERGETDFTRRSVNQAPLESHSAHGALIVNTEGWTHHR